MDIEIIVDNKVVGVIYHQILEKYSKMYQAMIKNSNEMDGKIMTQLNTNDLDIKELDNVNWTRVLEIINAQPFVLDYSINWNVKRNVLKLVLVIAQYFVMDELCVKTKKIIGWMKLNKYIHTHKPNKILHLKIGSGYDYLSRKKYLENYKKLISKILYKKDNYIDIWNITEDTIKAKVTDILYNAIDYGHSYNDACEMVSGYYFDDDNEFIDTVIEKFLKKYGDNKFYIHNSIVRGYNNPTQTDNLYNPLFDKLYLCCLNDMDNIVKFLLIIRGDPDNCHRVGYCYIKSDYIGHLKYFNREYPVYDLKYYFNSDS